MSGPRIERTIPGEAWEHVGTAVLRRNACLYLDAWHMEGKATVEDDSTDPERVHWLSYFTLDNYAEWVGATVLCGRGPSLRETMFRFDNVAAFKANGYQNPYREPGTPDWYFFWTVNHSAAVTKKWLRSIALLPETDLPQGKGGYGVDDQNLRNFRF